MRKIITVVLALVLLTVVAIPVSAATSASVILAVSNKTASEGGKVTVTVSATVDHCSSGDIQISYDKTVFELVSGEWLLHGTQMNAFDAGKADGVFVFENSNKISGEVFKFVLKVKANAEAGKETVTVKLKADSVITSKSVTVTVSCKHMYDGKCDPTCNQCNAVRKITHSYSWNCDATNHWEQCTSCGDQQKKSAHSMSGDWLSDENGHWYLCHCLQLTESQPHVWDEGQVNTEKGVVLYRCTVCGTLTAEQYIDPSAVPVAPEKDAPATGSNAEQREMSVKGIPVWILIACGLGVSLIVNIILLISVGNWRKRARQRKFTDY